MVNIHSSGLSHINNSTTYYVWWQLIEIREYNIIVMYMIASLNIQQHKLLNNWSLFHDWQWLATHRLKHATRAHLQITLRYLLTYYFSDFRIPRKQKTEWNMF